MPVVNCDCDCKYSENGECTKDEIDIGFEGCIDFEEDKEDIYTDEYYAFCIRNDKKSWEKCKGRKIEVAGREMFERYSSVTDGRTGCLIGCIKDIDDKRIEQLNERMNELENENGLSPLYTENPKHQVVDKA